MDEDRVSGTARMSVAKLKKVWAALRAVPEPRFKVSLIKQPALRRTLRSGG